MPASSLSHPGEGNQVIIVKKTDHPLRRQRIRDVASSVLSVYVEQESQTPEATKAMALKVIQCLCSLMGLSLKEHNMGMEDMDNELKAFCNILAQLSPERTIAEWDDEDDRSDEEAEAPRIAGSVEGTSVGVVALREASVDSHVSEQPENGAESFAQSSGDTVGKEAEAGINGRSSTPESISRQHSRSSPVSPTPDMELSPRKTRSRQGQEKTLNHASISTKKRKRPAPSTSSGPKKPKLIGQQQKPATLGKSFTVEHVGQTFNVFTSAVQNQKTPLTPEQESWLQGLLTHTCICTSHIVQNFVTLSIYKTTACAQDRSLGTLHDAPKGVQTFLQSAWRSYHDAANDRFGFMRTCHGYYTSYANLEAMIKGVSATPCDQELANWITEQVGARTSKQKHKSWLFDALAKAGGLRRETNSNGDTPIRRYITKCYHMRLLLSAFGGPGVLPMIAGPQNSRPGSVTLKSVFPLLHSIHGANHSTALVEWAQKTSRAFSKPLQ